MIDSFTLSHGTQVNRESLSAQTKTGHHNVSGKEAKNRQNCGTNGQRGMMLARVIREHPFPRAQRTLQLETGRGHLTRHHESQQTCLKAHSED